MLAFQDGLRKLGWTEGHNIQIDPRWAVDAESMQRLAKDLVARKPDLISAQHTHHGGLAARNANYPNRFRVGFRSGWQQVCHELPAAGQ